MLWVSPAITIYICVLTVVLGACMGSFLNCMAWRIVHGESVLHGRSHCDVCGHVLGAGDLIPVVSYIIHKGRCKYCGAKLSAGHVFAEVLTALTFLLLVLKYDISLQALEYILLACLLLAAAFTDLEGYMIPDRFIVTGIVVRVVFLFLQGNVLENLMDALAAVYCSSCSYTKKCAKRKPWAAAILNCCSSPACFSAGSGTFCACSSRACSASSSRLFSRKNVPQETGQRKKTESFFRGGRPSRRQRFSRSFAAARSSACI